jgi:hypothetical protein
MPCYDPRDNPGWASLENERIRKEKELEERTPKGMSDSQNSLTLLSNSNTILCKLCQSMDKSELVAKKIIDWYINHLVDDVVHNRQFNNTKEPIERLVTEILRIYAC